MTITVCTGPPKIVPPKVGRWAKVESRYTQPKTPQGRVRVDDLQELIRRNRGEHCHAVSTEYTGIASPLSARSISSDDGARTLSQPVKLRVPATPAAPALKQAEYDQLRHVFNRLDLDGDGVVTPKDFFFALRDHKVRGITKKDAHEILWEVSPFHPPGLNYLSLVEVYARCKADVKGVEPKRFYNYLVYSLMDPTCSGVVTTDDVLSCRHADESLLVATDKVLRREIFNNTVEGSLPGNQLLRAMQSGALVATMPEASVAATSRRSLSRAESSPESVLALYESPIKKESLSEKYMIRLKENMKKFGETDFNMLVDSHDLRSTRESSISGITDVWAKTRKARLVKRTRSLGGTGTASHGEDTCDFSAFSTRSLTATTSPDHSPCSRRSRLRSSGNQPFSPIGAEWPPFTPTSAKATSVSTRPASSPAANRSPDRFRVNRG